MNRALNPRSKREIRRWYERTILPFLIQEHEGNKLPKKGNNKAKRFDLNQVNLALLVTKDEGIPLMHHTYEGNRHDAKKFPGIIRKVTIVFDKGNNSKKNIELLDKTAYHFVESLKPYGYKHFLEIPLEEFKLVQRENEEEKEKKDDISAYRTRKEALGAKRVVVVTYRAETL